MTATMVKYNFNLVIARASAGECGLSLDQETDGNKRKSPGGAFCG